MAGAVRIEVLGPLRVLRDGVPVRVTGRRQRLLLAVLAADRGRMVPLPRLIDALWPPDAAPKEPVNTVQQYVAALRAVLHPPGPGAAAGAAGPGAAIVTAPAGYRLDLPPGALDTDDVDDLLGQCRTLTRGGRLDAARAAGQRALDLWRGRPFEEFETHGALRPALQAIRRGQLDVTEALAGVMADLGHDDAVVALLAPHPGTWQARERLAAALMASLAAVGPHGTPRPPGPPAPSGCCGASRPPHRYPHPWRATGAIRASRPSTTWPSPGRPTTRPSARTARPGGRSSAGMRRASRRRWRGPPAINR